MLAWGVEITTDPIQEADPACDLLRGSKPLLAPAPVVILIHCYIDLLHGKPPCPCCWCYIDTLHDTISIYCVASPCSCCGVLCWYDNLCLWWCNIDLLHGNAVYWYALHHSWTNVHDATWIYCVARPAMMIHCPALLTITYYLTNMNLSKCQKYGTACI